MIRSALEKIISDLFDDEDAVVLLDDIDYVKGSAEIYERKLVWISVLKWFVCLTRQRRRVDNRAS